MREAKSIEIGGLTFSVQQLPAMRSMRLLHKLGATVGPALLKMAGGMKGTDLAKMELGGLGEAAAMLFDRLSAEQF
jgi:hypothetical protein